MKFKVKQLVTSILMLILVLGLLAGSCTAERVQAAPMTAEMVKKVFSPAAASEDVVPGIVIPGMISYFARYEGIDGESDDAAHDNWIEILSIDWGAEQPGNGLSGMSRRRGDVVVEDLVITMAYEKSSPKLQEKCFKGEVIPKLEIELTTMFGETRATYLKYELTNVMITSFDFSGSMESGGWPILTVSNNFEEVKVTYTEYDDDGTSKGNVEFEYDVERESR